MNVEQSKIDELNLKIIAKYGRNTCLDGIINLEVYNKTKPKILWILKEPNWGEDSVGIGEDVENLFDAEIRTLLDNPKSNLAVFHADVITYKDWKSTYQNIISITHGILEKVFKHSEMKRVDSEGKIDEKYYLDYVAFINVKKHPGGSKANGKLIKKSFDDHKAILLEQIKLINPDIIFNCSQVGELNGAIRTDFLGGAEYEKEDYYFHYAKTDSKILIDTYHPMNLGTSLSAEGYVDENLKVIKDKFQY